MTEQAAPMPSWLDGFVDILQARRRTWVAAAIAVVLLGALLALLAPSLLPPTLLMGVAVGIAAALLATAVVVALDSADVVVRGPRHVVAAGGQVAGTISRAPGDIDALMALIDRHGSEHGVRVALTPASRSAGVPGARANMIAEELAQRDLKVLCTDLTRGRTPAVGLSDVLSGERKLADAVRFDEELFLAHLAIGSEPEAALAGFADWANSLPDDLDVLVAALPPLAEPGVLPAVQGVELVLVLVEVDRTERVDLIACLDAIDAAAVPAALVLVDPELDTSQPISTSVAVIDHGVDSGSIEGERRTVDLVDAPAEPAADAADGDVLPPDRDFDDDQTPSQPPRASVTRPGATGPATTATGPAATATSVTPAPATSDELDFDDDDDDAVAPVPGGGHVRTLRARRAASAAESGPSDPGVSEPDASPSGAPSAGAPTTGTGPAPTGSSQPRPASSGSRSTDSGRAAVTADARAPASRRGSDATAASTDPDDIDDTAREAARLTASLHSLASEVWQRGDE